jgi:hypothetical protein
MIKRTINQIADTLFHDPGHGFPSRSAKTFLAAALGVAGLTGVKAAINNLQAKELTATQTPASLICKAESPETRKLFLSSGLKPINLQKTIYGHTLQPNQAKQFATSNWSHQRLFKKDLQDNDCGLLKAPTTYYQQFTKPNFFTLKSSPAIRRP